MHEKALGIERIYTFLVRVFGTYMHRGSCAMLCYLICIGFLSKAACSDRHTVLVYCISCLVSIDLDNYCSPCLTNALHGSFFTCQLCDVHGLHIYVRN